LGIVVGYAYSLVRQKQKSVLLASYYYYYYYYKYCFVLMELTAG
jgi:hypothetical protein